MTLPGTALPCAGLLVAIGSFAAAQSVGIRPETPRRGIVCDEVSRVADPKLVGGGARMTFHYEAPSGSGKAFANPSP